MARLCPRDGLIGSRQRLVERACPRYALARLCMQIGDGPPACRRDGGQAVAISHEEMLRRGGHGDG